MEEDMTALTNIYNHDLEPFDSDSPSVRNLEYNISSHGAKPKIRGRKASEFSHVEDSSTLRTWLWFPIQGGLSEPNVSPFDELANSYEIAAREIIDSIKSDNRIAQGATIGEELQNLIEIDEEEILFNPKSLKCFFDFLVEYKSLKPPTLSITPNRDLYAQWRETAEKKLSMVFMSNGTLQFVLFVPNKNRPSQIFRIAGSESIKTILQDLQSYGIDEWVKYETNDS